MLKIKNNEIYISKGDTATININISQGGSTFTLPEGASIVFTVDTPTQIKKTITDNKLELVGADTENINAGIYEYDLKLVFKQGEQVAITKPTPFVIKEVV